MKCSGSAGAGREECAELASVSRGIRVVVEAARSVAALVHAEPVLHAEDAPVLPARRKARVCIRHVNRVGAVFKQVIAK